MSYTESLTGGWPYVRMLTDHDTIAPKMLRLSTQWRGAIAILAFGLCLVTSPFWLPLVGDLLVLGGADAAASNAHADAIAIPDSRWMSSTLGGDRALVASRWVQQGRAAWVVMTCGQEYGVSGCEMIQRGLAVQGRPKLPLYALVLRSSPAPVEAAALLAEVARIGARSAIVLVDELESRRMNGVYQREGKKRGIQVTVLYVRDAKFRAADWWRSREGWKAMAYELCQWAGVP